MNFLRTSDTTNPPRRAAGPFLASTGTGSAAVGSFDTSSPASIRWTTMDDTATQQDAAEQATAEQRVEELLDDELLVEEISIDGMCGVY